MGIYYDWVNLDKKEFICPNDFNQGNKVYETTAIRNPFLGALYDLLASDWRGDTLIFLGDDVPIPDSCDKPVLHRLHADWKASGQTGTDWDYVYETYHNISGLYKASESEVRNELNYKIENNDWEFDEYKVDPNDPFNGLFVREPRFFRYTVNHTKREYIDIDALPSPYNPLPVLLAFPGREEEFTGNWLGDELEVSESLPPADYKDMSQAYGFHLWA